MAASNHQASPLELVTSNCVWPKMLSLETPNIANPSIRWRLGSRLVVPTVGLFSHVWMNLANSSTVHHAAILYEALNQNYLASRSTRSWFGSSSTSTERRPLITYSNHASCLDDPLMWGALLPLKWQFNSDRHRWSGAASEVCFSKQWHSMFFSLGKTFPIIRGEGIYQPAMDYASKLMKAGQWLHFFPHGKVIPRPENADADLLLFRYDDNGVPIDLKKIKAAEETASAAGDDLVQKVEKSFTDTFFTSKLSTSTASLVANYSLKWGLARLIIEHVLGEGVQQDTEYGQYHENGTNSQDLSTPRSLVLDPHPEGSSKGTVLPEVDILPIYHIGMDDVLPTKRPYVPRVFQKVTFLVRPEGPIRIDRDFLLRLFGEEPANSIQSGIQGLSLTEKRIRLMTFLEEELNNLRDKAQWLHDKFNQPMGTITEER